MCFRLWNILLKDTGLFFRRLQKVGCCNKVNGIRLLCPQKIYVRKCSTLNKKARRHHSMMTPRLFLFSLCWLSVLPSCTMSPSRCAFHPGKFPLSLLSHRKLAYPTRCSGQRPRFNAVDRGAANAFFLLLKHAVRLMFYVVGGIPTSPRSAAPRG